MLKNLMLNGSVRQAVRDRKFNVYAVQYIDEALSLLTGKDAGERDGNGDFPSKSVNGMVEQQLIKYARVRQNYVRADTEHESE